MHGVYQFGAQVVETRVADPADAATLGATVAQAFDGYRAWAPDGWSAPEGAEATGPSRGGARTAGGLVSRRRVEGRPGRSRRAFADNPRPTGASTPGDGKPLAVIRSARVAGHWCGRCTTAELLSPRPNAADIDAFSWTPSGAGRARGFYEREGWTLTGDRRNKSPLGLSILEYAREIPPRRR